LFVAQLARIAIGHMNGDTRFRAYEVSAAAAGCGGLRSSANDLLKYLSAMLSDTAGCGPDAEAVVELRRHHSLDARPIDDRPSTQ
jgi:hypothetical protein